MTMQAIETRFIGQTNTKPSRIKATACGVASLTMSKYAAEEKSPDRGNHEADTHRVVAEALRDKLGWKGNLICGGTKRGYVFVFAGHA